MAWDFDGVNQYVRFTMNSTLQAAPGGPMSMACVIYFDSTTDGAVIHMLTSAQASRPWIEMFGNWNYGTTAGARSGPAGVTGAWYLAIFSKNTGNIAPEYTIIPLATGGTGTSGTLTGGGVTLGDGSAAGAGGIIQVARWGTSATEYIDGRIAATAIWNVYLNQAAREALTTWALWLSSTGIQWAVHFDTLSTLTDATGLGGGETGRFGTATQTLGADPGALAIDFFAAGGGGTSVQDTSGGSGTSGTTDGLAIGNGSGGEGTTGSTDGLALGDGSGGSGTGGATDGRALGSGSDGGGTAGSGDGLALGAGSGGSGTAGDGNGLAVGDASGGGGTAGSTETVNVGGVTVQDASGGAGTGGSADGLALGAGSDGSGTAGSGTGTAVGDGAGGAGSGGSTDGRALGDTSGGAATGSSGSTVAGGPVTISDTSGGVGTGGSPDTAETSQVVHDTMVMPIVLKAQACLVVEVGKVAHPPKHVQIRPGATFTAMADQFTDECCDGIAWVRPGSQTPTTGHWPDPIDNVDGVDGGEPVYWAIQLEMGIERCIPTVSNVEGDDGGKPTGAQWLQATQDHLDDAAALRRAVCCLWDFYGKDGVLMGPITPMQNEGNCGGQLVTVTVRAPACDCIESG